MIKGSANTAAGINEHIKLKGCLKMFSENEVALD